MNKQSYRRPRYRTRFLPVRQALAIALALIVLVVLLILRFAAPGVLTTIFSPLWKSGTALTASVGNASTMESRSGLIRDRDSLTSQNATLTIENASLSARVADLQSLLGTRTEPEKGIIGNVLARPPVAPYDVLVIDQGTDVGVAVNSRVSGLGGTPVGVISEANKSSSRVTLYSSSGISTSGWGGASRIPLTLTGEGAGAFLANVPKDAGMKVGDGVYIVGASTYPIGTVTKIDSDPSSPSVVLHVRPYSNPFSLTVVSVERK